jgi:hypothetical protein
VWLHDRTSERVEKMKCVYCRRETDAGVEIHITIDEKTIETFNEIAPKFLPIVKPIREPIREVVWVPLCSHCQELVPPLIIRLSGIFAVLRNKGLVDDRLLDRSFRRCIP